MPLALRHPTPAALRPAAAPVLRTTSQAATPRNKAVELQAELRLASNDRKREFLQALRIKNAANHLRSLPEPNTSLHCVMKGNYNAWDLVPAFLKLCHPDTLSYLGIATLGFNYRNAAQLIELIDSQQIAQVDFVCSLMYADHEKSVCQDLFDKLTARHSRFGAIRNHAKVMLFQTTADRCYTYEGSANLRSCRNIEQFSLTQDKQLFEFHRSWLNQVLTDHPYQPQTAVRPSHPGRATNARARPP